MDDSGITRRQAGLPDMFIHRFELKYIWRQRGGSLLLQGRSSNELIFIPKNVDHFEQLEEELAQWQPIETRAANALFAARIGIRILRGATLLLAVSRLGTLTNIIGALLFAGLTVYQFVLTQRNPNAGRAQRASSWLWLLVAVFLLLYVLFFSGWA